MQEKLYSFITNNFKKNATYNLATKINPDDKYCVKSKYLNNLFYHILTNLKSFLTTFHA